MSDVFITCWFNVLQTLYSGTVRFNILLGATKPHAEVTQEEIERACRDANILDFINSLPKFVFMFLPFVSYLLRLGFQTSQWFRYRGWW